MQDSDSNNQNRFFRVLSLTLRRFGHTSRSAVSFDALSYWCGVNCSLIFVLLIFTVACGDDVFDPIATPTAAPQATPTISQPPEPVLVGNPPCEMPERFSGGTLWKPRADHNPFCVFLIRDQFSEPFDCKVELKSGGMHSLRFTGFANGDRQHHRCSVRAKEIKRGAVVLCDDGQQVCEFRLPGKATKRWE